MALGGGGASHWVGGVVRSNHFKLKGEDQTAMSAEYLMSRSSPTPDNYWGTLCILKRSPYVLNVIKQVNF